MELKRYTIADIEIYANGIASQSEPAIMLRQLLQLLSEREAEIAKLKINCSGFELESIRLGKKVAEQGADLTKLREVNETQWEHCEELKGKLQQQDSIIYDLRELVKLQGELILILDETDISGDPTKREHNFRNRISELKKELEL